MSFTGKSPKNTYKDILQISNSNSGVDSTQRAVKTAEGSNTSIMTSDRSFSVKSNTDNANAFAVRSADGTFHLNVDTTNSLVQAMGHNVTTNYAYFGVSSGLAGNYSANAHYALPFSGVNHTLAEQDNIALGTSTDPATSFTTADGSTTDASLILPVMWFLPDNITVDSVTSFEGGNNATGATTRMHLMSYDFTSGSTSALTNGTLIAHNSDVTNAGSEQAYKSTFTVDSANVDADKVLLATFLTTDVTGDYSVSVIVKYHLR